MSNYTKVLFTLSIVIFSVVQSHAEINPARPDLISSEAYKKTGGNPVCSDSYYGADYRNYLGEKLILKGLHKTVESIGYSFFYKDYRASANYIGEYPKSQTDYGSYYRGPDKSSEFKGSVFKVTDIIEGSWMIAFLELKNLSTSEIVYFEYNKDSMFFPFFAPCYLNMVREEVTGMSYRATGKSWSEDGLFYDLTTGEEVFIDKGDLFEYVDIVIDENASGLNVVIATKNDTRLAIPYSKINDQSYVYVDKFDIYRKRFGKENWENILNGQIRIGMTDEMVLLALGKPIKVSKLHYTNTDRRIWVYDDRDLFFDDRILTVVRD